MTVCKKLSVLLFCLVGYATVTATPVLRWLRTTYDFGAFDESLGVVECVFEGVNDGDEPLVTYNVRANCGCTVPHYDKHPVAPGDTLRIKVGFNAVGRPGKFEKSVTVTTNAEPAKSTLYIEGTVIGTSETLRTRYPFSSGSLKLRQNHLNYGDVAKGNSRSLYIEGYNQSKSPVVPCITGAPSYIDVTVKPDTVAPGEPFVVSTIFQTAACPVWDIVTDSIVLTAPDGSSLPITTIANIYDDFHTRTVDPCMPPALKITPGSIDLGRVDVAADSKPISHTITLQNTSKNKVELRRVYTMSPGITLKIKGNKTVKGGKKSVIEVSVDPAVYADNSFIDAKILIISDDPARPRNVVEVLGEIVK